MQMRSSARRMDVARLIATLSFTSMVATGTFVANASPAWAAPKKKKKAKAADSSDDVAPEPAATTSSSDSSDSGDVDSLMQKSTSTKRKSNQQVKADSEAAANAEKPEKQAINEPDAWEKPPVEEEKPKPKKTVGGVPEEPKGDGRNIDIGLLVGWGFQTSKYFAVDPYTLGGGVEGWYEFENHLSLGVGFEIFKGTSNVAAVIGPNAISTSAYYMLAHAGIGYNWWLGKWMLRPSLWLGAAIGTQNPPMASGTSGVETTVLLGPGLTLHRLLGDNGWFIGADARLSLIAGHNGNSAVALFLTFGHRF